MIPCPNCEGSGDCPVCNGSEKSITGHRCGECEAGFCGECGGDGAITHDADMPECGPAFGVLADWLQDVLRLKGGLKSEIIKAGGKLLGWTVEEQNAAPSTPSPPESAQS